MRPMNTNDLPIACTLTTAELQERRRTNLERVKQAIVESRELEDGYALSFPSSTESLKELTSLVDLERQCCPFLTYRITVEANSGPLWLEVTGPDGTKDFLRNTFDWNMS
ncbi:MAG: hypothetical protein ACXW18_01330 [Pyrinomonadaceae bacterium]